MPVHSDGNAGFLLCAVIGQIQIGRQRNRQLRPADTGSIGERTILAVLFVSAGRADLTVGGGSFFVDTSIGVIALPHRVRAAL